MSSQRSLCRTIIHYSQFYFFTIALSLGSGILGLPTTLVDSGIQPFIVTILLCYIVQILLCIFVVEALQKAYARNVDKLRENTKELAPTHTESIELSTHKSQDNLLENPANEEETIQECLPNLFELNELFLPYFLPYLVTANQCISIIIYLISYTLAGSQALGSVFHVSVYRIIPIFSWVLTAIVIIFQRLITFIISILTIIEGVSFIIAILLTFVASLQGPVDVTNNFKAIGDPLLMSLVTLSGFATALPVMFSKVKQQRNDIVNFIVSVCLGLTTCLFLNLLWCWSVLAIVPQYGVCLSSNGMNNISETTMSLSSARPDDCIKTPSLEDAAANGQIATVPLTRILSSEHNSTTTYIARSVQTFVAISVAVAFLTIGSVIYQTLAILINSFWSPSSESDVNFEKTSKYINLPLIRQWFLAFIIFTMIYIIASSCPKSFNVFVNQTGSFFLCIEYGIFFPLIIYQATYSPKYRFYKIPLELPKWFVPFQYIIPIYYLSALIYDMYSATNLFYA